MIDMSPLTLALSAIKTNIALAAKVPAARPYLLSFRSGIVRPMEAATLAAAEAEALARCVNMMQPANIVDRETYRVLSCVVLDRLGFSVERRGHA